MPTTTYSTDNDIYLAFGTTNVRKWADVDNDNVYASVEARLDWARTQAKDELDSRLATCPYQFPLDDAADVPLIVVRMEAYLAAVYLYESRGVTDVDPVTGKTVHALSAFKLRVEQFIRDLHSRKLTLQNVTMRAGVIDPITTSPDFVSFDDPSDRSTSITAIGDDFITLP